MTAQGAVGGSLGSGGMNPDGPGASGYPGADRPSVRINPTVAWWQPDKSKPREVDWMDRATALVSETAAIEMRQSTWHETNLWNASLFANRQLVGFRWGTIEAHGELVPNDCRTESLVEEIGEALLAKASSSPLTPSLVPHGNSYKVEKAVRRADYFLKGCWRHVRGEEACVQAFLDAYLSGLGTVRVGWDPVTKSALAEPVFFDNVIVDNRECSNRQNPRHYRIRQVSLRSSVETRYGVDLGKQGKYVDYRQIGDGWVVVVEAFRLPDVNGAGGRHTVACCGMLLVDEVWTHPWVPFAFLQWRDPVSGFFPRSGVELVLPYQIRLNQLNDAIEESQDIACRPRILLHAGSNIDVNQWDNEAGRILGYSGVKPEPMVWPTNLEELYNERERVRAMAHAYMGLSMTTTTGELPPQVRLDSSAGVREFRNMEDMRHIRMWTKFERFRLEVAQLLISVMAAGEGSDSYTATYHPSGGRAHSECIPFKSLRVLDQEWYSWSMECVPLHEMAPAARRELVRDWTSRGLMDINEARRAESNPNLERIEDLELASQDDILRHLQILENGEYEAPTQITNLTYGIPRVTQNYHRLRDMEDVEQEVFDNHLRWLGVAAGIQQAAVQAQQMQQAQMQAAASPPFSPGQGAPGSNATPSLLRQTQAIPSQ
jgi:hypothetical protein